jgi:MerR family transcriptional regulator, aldehyde-responsive regulator
MTRTDTAVRSIQEVARLTGFSDATLRYYERIGLIGPVPRDESSGHRYYDEDAVRVIESLACLRTSGLPIEDMRRYLTLLAQGPEAAAEQHALFAAHAARVADEITRLQVRLRYLRAKTDLWGARERGDTAAEARAAREAISAAGELR